MTKRVYIINAHASRVARKRKRLMHLLEDEGVDRGDIKFLDDPKRLKATVARAAEKYDVIVLGGGDGTVNNGIGYAMEAGFGGDFGILPLGTSNYLARNLEIPLDLAQAIVRIRLGKPTRVHLAIANEAYVFSLLAVVGFSTAVNENIQVRLKQRIGQAAYLVEIFRQLRKNDSFGYELTLDDGTFITGRTHQIMIVNGKINGQINIAPESSLDHNNLRVVIHKSRKSALGALWSTLVYTFTLGRVKRGYIDVLTSELNLETEKPLSVSFDGETHTKTPVDIKMYRRRVKIIR